MRDHFFGKLFVLIAVILFSMYASAFSVTTDFTNGSFESGNLVDWDVNAFVPFSATTASGTQNVESGDASDGSFSFDLNASVGVIGQNNRTHAFRIEMENTLDVNLSHDLNITFDYKLVSTSVTPPVLIISYTEAGTGDRKTFVESSQTCVADNSTNITASLGTTSGYETRTFRVPTCVNMDATTKLTISTMFRITCGGSCTNENASWKLDDFRFFGEVTPTLINSFIAPTIDIPTNTDFLIAVNVINDFNDLVVPDADVNFTFNSVEQVAVFSVANQRYESTFTSPSTRQDLNVLIESSKSGFVSDTDEFVITIIRPEFQFLTITLIENIASFSFNSVDFIPSNDNKQIIWQVDSNSATPETIEFNIVNDNVDGKQYFIFTGTDLNNLAFDDTLTLGSNNTNPIQKIWNQDDEKYTHSFEDTLSAGETKIYKLTYKSPFKHFFTIKDSPEWSNSSPISILDVNTVSVDSFSISAFTNIRSIFKEQIPDVLEDESGAFEFQFTAHSDVNGTNIEVSRTILNADEGSDFSVGTVELSNTPHRFSFTIDAFGNFNRQFLIKTSNSTAATIFITDYAIVARGFFTKRLELFKANMQPLDVFLLNGSSTRFIQEGRQFRIDTEAYDREGLLRTLQIESFLDGISDNNRVSLVTTILNFDEPNNEFEDPDDVDETTLTFFQVLQEPIIDLSGNAFDPDPPRTVTIQARLIDSKGKTVAIQSQTVTFLQYPFFPDDLVMNFFATEKKKGKHPKGLLQLSLSVPSVLLGLDLRIFTDSSTVTSPDFRDVIYKPNDFDCISTNCSFEIKFDDFIFEDVNLTTITVLALLNTETLDLSNRLTRTDTRIFVTPIEFTVAKIHQVVERIDDIYRNDEEIPLVLILRDTESTNIRNQVDVFITLENCDVDTNGNCTVQTTEFKPTGFIYDDESNLNYYFFRHLFILDDGSLLPDGNFIGFHATIDDKLGIRTEITPVLASKCFNDSFKVGIAALGAPYLSSILGEGTKEFIANLVCSGNPQNDIVSTTVSIGQEERLEIDIDHVTSSPSQEAIVCIAPNIDNIINKPLEADLLCFVLYTIGEKPIDDFRFRITNQFSDLTNESATKQFLEFNIPYAVIAFNDIFTLKAQLELFSDTSINTLGEFIFEGFRSLVTTQFDLYALTTLAEFQTKTGIIQNIGGDIDFSQSFDPTVTTTGYFFIVKGIPIENIHKFALDNRFGDAFEFIDRKNFFNFMAENNIPLPENSTTLEVFSISFVVPFEFKSDGTLIIEEIVPQKLNQTDSNFAIVPTVLSFNMQNTMFFNNFSENDTLSFVINILVIIKQGALEGLLGFIDEFSEDPVGATTDVIFNSIFIIAIVIALVFMFSLVRRNLAGGGNGGGG